VKLWMIGVALAALCVTAFTIAAIEVFWLEPRKRKQDEFRRAATKGIRQIYP
jgi:hypothetical protein